MNDYYKVIFNIQPASVDTCDLLADSLADVGFESFEPTDSGETMNAYIPSDQYDSSRIDKAIAGLPIPADIDYESEFIEGQDWNAEWERNYFKPILVAGKVVVHSSFHTDIPKAQYDIVIDPRMAFGTGHHSTTALMMQALLNADIENCKIIDMGTGTGILAILASMLGAKEVAAIEIDPFAVENARDNVALNLKDAHCNVSVIEGDASVLADYKGFADIFLANINRNIITADINRYAEAMAPGALITVSGFYVDDRTIISKAAAAAGLDIIDVADLNNWSSMTFIKPKHQ